MNPSSCGSADTAPPSASALSTSPSTSSRLCAETLTIAPVATAGSATSLVTKDAKNGRTSSITKACSLITMQVACSSVNWLLNVNPRPVKNSTEVARSATGRFTKMRRDMGLPDGWWVRRRDGPRPCLELIGPGRTNAARW